MGSKYTHVFDNMRIRGVDFKNRIFLAPPSPNLAGEDGKVTAQFVDMFRAFARGGAAAVNVGNSMIDYKETRDEERQLDLSSDDIILPLTRYAEACLAFGCQPNLEINHNGKDSDSRKTGKPPISASPVISSWELYRSKLEGREPVPAIEMDHAKIDDIVNKYGMAALRCKRAGFNMAMIHGGHGNLISQFASPLYNKRKDDYGGSLENRTRFTIDVLDKVRELCGKDFVIEFRVSADEIHPDGMHFEETLKYIELFKEKVDILHVSAGLHGEFQYMRNWWQNYMMDRMYNVHHAEKIKKAFPGLIVCTVGSIMNIRMAEEIISSGKADFVAMCRPLLADPEMPRKYALGREEDHRPCLRCQYCGSRLMIPAVLNCAVNPYLGNEREFPNGIVGKAEKKKRVAVVGGGPAGVQAMLTLIDRGHGVTLYEMTDKIGGLVVPGSIHPFKQDIRDYLKYMQCQVAKAPARVLMNTEVTKEILDKEKYDAIILAVGSRPIVPELPGIDKAHVHWAPDACTGKVKTGEKIGKKIVIIGAGAVGIECAIDLKEKGNDVSIVEMAPDLGHLMQSASGAAFEFQELIAKLDIPVHLSCMLEEVKDDSILCSNTKTSEKVEFPADTVLLALGMAAKQDVADSLRHSAPETEVFVVGDAVKPGLVGPAVMSAFRAAAYI
jgi:2,4-dienoyl-CoA reductase-like NADH-dependent reductase (Old Yellow Enzyme family)/NADPH-dependent 2,4-dienoyl-CoA reductase/sulfur reductase-like enzyme